MKKCVARYFEYFDTTALGNTSPINPSNGLFKIDEDHDSYSVSTCIHRGMTQEKPDAF